MGASTSKAVATASRRVAASISPAVGDAAVPAHGAAVVAAAARARIVETPASGSAPYASPVPELTQTEASIRELEARVNRRSPLHRRLDDTGEDNRSRTDGESRNGLRAEEVDHAEHSTRPHDDEAAGVQEDALQGGDASGVSVRRLRVSSPSDSLTEAARAALHAKSEATASGAAALGEGITSQAGDAAGAAALAVWDAMQLNPALLDSSAAISRSSVQAIFAAMALGTVPAAALPRPSSKQRVLLSASAAGSDADDSAASGTALVPLSPDAIDALVPAGTTLDAMMLARPPPQGIRAWGARPPEGSPYDQLILHDADEELRLDRGVSVEVAVT